LVDLIRSRQRLVMFAGAGISMSAGIPGANGVVNLLRARHPAAFDPARSYGYVEAFEQALPGNDHRAERRLLFETLCAGVRPAEEHDWIAALVNAGIVQSVITTNFDHLLDFAIVARCRRQPFIFTSEDEFDPELATIAPSIVKLHGDFLFDSLANLPAEMRGRLGRNMREKLRQSLRGAAMLVVGYSGADETVMSFLRELASEEGVLPSIWWSIYDECERDSAVREVIDAARATGKTAEIIGPASAKALLAKIGAAIGMTPPRPIPFGIDPELTNPHVAFAHRLVRARQHRAPPTRPLTSAEARLLARLHAATATAGRSWMHVRAAPADEIVSHLTSARMAVFDARLAPQPSEQAFLEQMRLHAAVQGINAAELASLPELLLRLFANGTLVVILHPFEPDDDTEAWSDVLIRLFIAQSDAGAGHVLVISSVMALSFLFEMGQQVLRRDPSATIPDVGLFTTGDETRFAFVYDLAERWGISRAAGDALRALAALRFAPSRELLARASGDAETATDELLARGLMRMHDDAVVLAPRVARRWRKRVRNDDRAKVAIALEAEAAIQPPHLAAQLTIEAEYQWSRAGNRDRALALLLRTQVTTRTARYFCARLSAWRRHFSFDSPRLAPADGLKLIHHFTAAVDRAVPPVAGAKDELSLLVRAVEKQLPPAWVQLLHASAYRTRKPEYGYLRRAWLLAKRTKDAEALAWATRMLSAYWIAMAMHEKPGSRSARHALLFSRAAVARSESAGDQRAARMYRDNVFAALMELAHFDEAREVALTQVRDTTREEGLTYTKGVAYGNLMLVELLSGNWAVTEGLFDESQLNFWYSASFANLITNLNLLWRKAFETSDPALPSAHDISTAAIRIGTAGWCDQYETAKHIGDMLRWRTEQACMARNAGDALAAIDDHFRLRVAMPDDARTDAALVRLWRTMGIAYFTFGDPVFDALQQHVTREGRLVAINELFLELLRNPRLSVEARAIDVGLPTYLARKMLEVREKTLTFVDLYDCRYR
jgi:hypothetical protein